MNMIDYLWILPIFNNILKLYFVTGEVIPMLEHNIDRWKEDLVQKGLVKGLATQKATFIDMLSDRFGEISTGWQSAINQIGDPQIISKLTINILKVTSADEYEQILMKTTKSH